MATLIYTHDAFGEHEVPDGHVERPSRYAAVEEGLRADGLDALERRRAPRAEREALLRAHQDAFVTEIEDASPDTGMTTIDADTYMGPSSLDAALRGAGGAVAAVDAVMTGEADSAFVASRPPGHHATPDRAMGFCLFNNVAVAALHARAAHGARRVAVVDFDVHHGNGTQDILQADEDAFFASSHEWPQWPGTGRASERGASGRVHNAPIPTGEGSRAFRAAWGDALLPALQDFDPDVVVVSAGFDAHAADPVGGLALDEDDYAWVTHAIRRVADSCCRGRVVSVLEGGYDLGALGRSAAAHVRALASRNGPR